MQAPPVRRLTQSFCAIAQRLYRIACERLNDEDPALSVLDTFKSHTTIQKISILTAIALILRLEFCTEN